MSSTPPPPPSSPPPDGFAVGAEHSAASPGGEDLGPGGRTIPPAWKRIVARLLDFAVVYMALGTFAAALVAGDDVGTVQAGEEVDAGSALLTAFIVLLVGFAWEAVPTKLVGGTPIKRAFRMRVVQAETGGAIDWRESIIRWGVFGIWWVVPFLALPMLLILVIVSLVFLFTKPLRQAVWDRAAKTVVVDG
jgi:uncharacterized RDD family membrane protein YckC